MATKDIKLKNKAGEILYPQTKTSLLINDDGTAANVDTRINSKVEQTTYDTHTHTFSGTQDINWSYTPEGDITVNSYTPEGTVDTTFTGTAKAPTGNFTGSTSTFNGTYTPEGTIIHSVSSTATDVYSGINATYEEAAKKLTVSFDTTSVIQTVTAGEATFKGTQKAVSVSGTPNGSITMDKYTPDCTINSTFTGTTKAPDATFTGKKYDHKTSVKISGTTSEPTK